MFTVNDPVPVPLLAWLPLVVGLWLVPQHTPRSVTVPPPLLVTLPPPVAEVEVMFITSLVVTVGSVTCSVKFATKVRLLFTVKV